MIGAAIGYVTNKLGGGIFSRRQVVKYLDTNLYESIHLSSFEDLICNDSSYLLIIVNCLTLLYTMFFLF